MKEFFLILIILGALFICFSLYCCLIVASEEDKRLGIKERDSFTESDIE